MKDDILQMIEQIRISCNTARDRDQLLRDFKDLLEIEREVKDAIQNVIDNE
jgi:hypothetical protein